MCVHPVRNGMEPSSGRSSSSGQRMTMRNSHISPRKSSVLSTASRNKITLSGNTSADRTSLRPICVTCFGDFVLAQLISASRTNYLAIWGPECHQCEAQELNIDSVKVRSLRPSPSTHLSSVDLCQVDPLTLCLFVSCSLVDLFVSSSMAQLTTALNDGSSMPMERSWR
jgi:hypothetical protein